MFEGTHILHLRGHHPSPEIVASEVFNRNQFYLMIIDMKKTARGSSEIMEDTDSADDPQIQVSANVGPCIPWK